MMARGFTLVELLVTTVILLVLASLTLPMLGDSDQVKSDATARILIADAQYAQMIALARPDVRVALQIDEDGKGWSIVDADSPGTPLTDALDEQHTPRSLVTRFGEGRASIAQGAHVSPEGGVLVFTPLGGLEAPINGVASHAGERTTPVDIDCDTGFAMVAH